MIIPVQSVEYTMNQCMDTSNGEIDDIGWFTSLCLDDLGRPHISYYDYTNKDLKYCYLNNNEWIIQTVDATGDVGKFTSLVLDEDERPHISYYDATNGDLKYAFLNTDRWEIETADSLGNVGLYTSIDLDSSDNPHISYCHYDLRVLKYAYFDGSNWKKTTVDNSAVMCADDYFCDYTSLKLDQNDTAHISYCDYENFDLKYAVQSGNTWQTEIVDSTGNVGVYSSLVLDKNENPHISYADFTNPDFDLKYAYKTSGEWTVDCIKDGGDVRKWTAIALDAHQQPHISYYDYTQGSLNYMVLHEDTWEKETVELEGSTGCFNSLQLNIDDSPFISYYDWGAKALKFAFKHDENWQIDVIEQDTNNDFVDQDQSYCSGYASPIYEESPLAQSFIPAYSVLTRVELMLVKRNDPGDFILSIREGLTDNDLVSCYVNSEDIPEDIAWKPFDFPDLAVEIGKTYYIICSPLDTLDYHVYFWYFDHQDPYVQGNGWSYDYGEWDEMTVHGFPGLDFGFKTFGVNTSIPDVPMINGPVSGKVNTEYEFTIVSDDEDNDQLWYEIEWSLDETERVGPYSAGESFKITHTWTKQGTYIVRVKAIDVHGAESRWATLPVSMPKGRGKEIMLPLYDLVNLLAQFFDFLRVNNKFWM